MNGSYTLASLMQDLFLRDAATIAQQTGFQKRPSKLNAPQFAQAIVFGFLGDPDITLDELAQTAAQVDAPVSPQAIDQRFTPRAVAFFEQLLLCQVRHVIRADDPVTAALLNRFSQVSLQDSTVIGLPAEFEARYRGCGGTTEETGRAALKFQVRLDLLRGGLEAIRIEEGRQCDQSTELQTEAIEPGSLHLRDLGYFDLGVLQTIMGRGAYFVSRLNDQALVLDPEAQHPLDLIDWLSGLAGATRAVERPVAIGANHRLPCRLVAIRVPPAIARRRRRELRRRAQKKGYTPSARKLALCDWNLYVTNAAADRLSIEEVVVLARLRWQIELLFKHWKSDGKLSRSRSGKPDRIACEVFAKLMGLIVEHWIVLRSCWGEFRISLRRASKAVRRCAMMILGTFQDPEHFAVTLELVRKRLQKAARKQKRRKQPGAFQLVETPTIYGQTASGCD
jgi:Transposase DDE domain